MQVRGVLVSYTKAVALWPLRYAGYILSNVYNKSTTFNWTTCCKIRAILACQTWSPRQNQFRDLIFTLCVKFDANAFKNASYRRLNTKWRPPPSWILECVTTDGKSAPGPRFQALYQIWCKYTCNNWLVRAKNVNINMATTAIFKFIWYEL